MWAVPVPREPVGGTGNGWPQGGGWCEVGQWNGSQGNRFQWVVGVVQLGNRSLTCLLVDRDCRPSFI